MDLKSITKWLNTAKPNWDKQGKVTINECRFLRNLVVEEADELQQGLINSNKEEVKDAIIDIIWMACNSAARLGISVEELEEYAKKVEDSNWSKFCTNEEAAIKSCYLYSIGKHPNKMGEKITCYYKKINTTYVIFREEDNKIMKSYLFEDVE